MTVSFATDANAFSAAAWWENAPSWTLQWWRWLTRSVVRRRVAASLASGAASARPTGDNADTARGIQGVAGAAAGMLSGSSTVSAFAVIMLSPAGLAKALLRSCAM